MWGRRARPKELVGANDDAHCIHVWDLAEDADRVRCESLVHDWRRGQVET
jgi:hypothetical protein